MVQTVNYGFSSDSGFLRVFFCFFRYFEGKLVQNIYKKMSAPDSAPATVAAHPLVGIATLCSEAGLDHDLTELISGTKCMSI